MTLLEWGPHTIILYRGSGSVQLYSGHALTQVPDFVWRVELDERESIKYPMLCLAPRIELTISTPEHAKYTLIAYRGRQGFKIFLKEYPHLDPSRLPDFSKHLDEFLGKLLCGDEYEAISLKQSLYELVYNTIQNQAQEVFDRIPVMSITGDVTLDEDVLVDEADDDDDDSDFDS